MDGIEIVQPNADMLAIARLYLETRDSLTEEERAVYLKMLRAMLAPVWKFSSASLRDRVLQDLSEARH